VILITKKSILLKKPKKDKKIKKNQQVTIFLETCGDMFWVNKASKGKVAAIGDIPLVIEDKVLIWHVLVLACAQEEVRTS
jgi:hypothetical protein